jgi:hypothetical protein
MSAEPLRIDPAIDLRHDAAARPAWRRPTCVHARLSATAGVVATREGEVRHTAGAAIITGRHGEQWPVERALFDANYEPVAPTRMGEDGTYRRRPLAVLARRYAQPFDVALGQDRGTLHGVAGDWLVQHAPGSLGVVSADTFAETYDATGPKP